MSPQNKMGVWIFMRDITPKKVDTTVKNLLILSSETEIKVIPLIEITGISLKISSISLIAVETRQERYDIHSGPTSTKEELHELFDKLKNLLSDFFSQGA